jgi:hypothetical protein
MKKSTFLLAGLLCAALGCIGPNHAPKVSMVAASSEPAVRKNYVVGVAKTIAPGEAIASVDNRLKVVEYPSSLRLRQAITLKTEKRILTLPNGRVLTYIGPAKLPNGNYVAYGNIYNDEGLGEFYYVTPDLALVDVVYIKDQKVFPTGMERIVSTWPERVKFKGTPAREKLLPGDRPGYDILFSGKDAGGIHLTYQEHAPDGSIDPAAVQRLTFPPDAERLECRGTVLRVQACTETKLVATVVAD